MLIFPTYGSVEVKPFPSNQTLYFDPVSKVQLIRDKWTLVMYYDMEPYWRGIKTYNKITNYQEQLCATIETQSHCNSIVEQARHDYQELEYYNELLLSQHFDVHARQRRAGQTGRHRRGLIDGVGYLANDLFGVLDSRFANQYEKDIETIHRNEKHLSNLWKNQTSVIEAEFNLMKRMENTVNKQHKLINKKLIDLQENESVLQRNLQNISYANEFTMLAMSGNGLLQGLKRLQDTLLDAITDIFHGQINIHLLPPTQLKRELQTIYGQMPEDLTLPITNIDTDLQYLYKLLKVKARATQKYVIIEVTFPLVARESFQLYKIVPIPHQTSTRMTKIIPVSEYVAVNLKKDSYFSMSTSELTECLHHGPTYMCQLLKPILDLKNDESFCNKDPETNTCTFEKSNCTNAWIELHLTSQHLYFCCDTYTIKIICGDQVTVRQLSQAGVIGVGQECIIKGKDFSLYSIRHQSNHVSISPTIYMPEFDQINHLVNIKIPDEKQMDDGNLTISMDSLGEKIKKLKESNSEIEEISPHDIHQYVICYVLLATVLCAAAVWMWKTGRCGLCRKPGQPGEGSCRHEAAVAPPKPRRRSGSRHEQELAAAPPTPKPCKSDNCSEVLSAKDLNNKSETELMIQ
ncbi:hypothetical protein HF086_004613 [Spodoptera exigua]|uniref:Envelope fusion protein n=1 Tax=Spodoptera exigua TaxID=7107 RepID=A0A922MSY8_SPOEX|nr:hypothetical protein HF086_004613 [Spodoptera exigua]